MGGGSRSRILLVLGLLLAMIGGVWWLLRGEEPAAADSGAGGSESAVSGAALDPAPATEAAPDPAGVAREAAPDIAAPPELHSATDGTLVKVVDAASRAPIAGAEVMWLYPEQWLHDPGQNGLHFGWAREIAPRVLAGADGIAVLPHLTGSLWIGASSAEASSCIYCTPSRLASPLTIEVLPEVKQAVRVQDPLGRPVAGARVGLLSNQRVRMTAVTDAGGIALLRDLQAVRSTGTQQPAYSLALIGPTASEQRIPYDYDAPPATTPVLELALGGEVEILLQDADGQPLTGIWPVQLRVDDPKRSGWESTEENADALTLPVRNSRVLFSHAALNLPLQATLRRRDGDRPVFTRFDGPRALGERVTAIIQLKDENPRITLRVLGPDGAALPGLRLLAQYVVELGYSSQFSLDGGYGLSLDAESRITFNAVKEEENRTERQPLRRLVQLSAADPRSGAAWSAQMLVPARLAPGLNDLGELHLEPTPLIAEGRVRTSEGQPVRERVDIQLQVRDAQGEWQPSRLQSEVVLQGHFRITGWPPPGELSLQARSSSGALTYQPFQLGTTGLEIVLDPVVPLQGTLLLDPDIPQRSVTLVIQNPTLSRRSQVGADGAWTISGLVDGVYTMSLQDWWSGRILWCVEGLAITGGKPADASVLEVDLRDKIRPLRIEVVDPEGQPVEAWRIRLLGGDRTQWRDRPKQYGDRILSTGEPLDFELQADRFARIQVRGVVADQRITLPRGIAVRVAILSPVPLPDDLEYGVGLHDEATEMYGFSYLDAAGSGEVWVPLAGTYRLGVTARGRQGDRSMTSDIRLDAETRARGDVVIPAEGLPGPIPIGLYLEDLDEVRKRHNE